MASQQLAADQRAKQKRQDRQAGGSHASRHGAVCVSTFQRLYQRWTDTFNAKQLERTCRLFAHNVRGTYAGTPAKTYETPCQGFRRLFATVGTDYRYTFRIRRVHRSGDLATVRITWHLSDL